MAGKPAATVGSNVSHPAPPVLTGSGSMTVLINNFPAWRGMPVGGGGAGGGGGGGGFDTSAISGSSASLLQEKQDATLEAQASGLDSDEYKEAVDAEAAANEMVGGIMDSLSSGLGGGLVQVLQSAKKASDAVLKSLKATKTAATGTLAYPAAELAEKAGQAMAAVMMGTLISGMAVSSINPMSGGMPDIHTCATPLPLPPHGPGLVIDGSATVLIQGMPAAKVGCTIVEALGPPNKIAKGSMNVMIGG